MENDIEQGIRDRPPDAVPWERDPREIHISLPPSRDTTHRRSPDPRPWKNIVSGYPSYSAFIASDEDRSTTIFRRFQRLSARNLLYLESELSELEAEQDRLDRELKNDLDLQLSAQNWDLLCLQAQGGGGMLAPEGTTERQKEEQRRVVIQVGARERLHLALRIREVLTAYQTALKLEHDILSLSAPDRRPLKGARRVFYTSHNIPSAQPQKRRKGQQPSPERGAGAAMIAGEIRHHLSPKNEKDLCVLAPPVERDRLTRLFEGRFSYFFRARTADGLSDFVSHAKVSLAVSIFSGLAAIIFLIGAIIGLYWVENPNAKLGMLSGLTVAFAGSLALFTNARRQDVFAATAAYAAVLVVFVSGNLSTSSPTSSTTSMAALATTTSFVTKSVTTTAWVSPDTITETATATTTAATATVTVVSHTLSRGAKLGIGLGLGLGLGLPVVFISLSLAFCLFA